LARLKVGVLISGRGSNLKVLLESCADPAFPAEIALVISNVADAFGLERARQAGIATRVVNHKEYPSREAFDAEMDRALRASGIELVCLAGFMRLLSVGFVESWQGKMVNIHPSLLPSFKGMRTHAQALAAGVKLHGCTVHYVTPALDDGPIIAQGAVPVLAGDTEEMLADRVLAVEHQLYPLALKLIAGGKAGRPDPKTTLINPTD
jgi:phosphoribosylglycinamide formyltransferase-1